MQCKSCDLYDTSGLLLTWPWNAVWLCSDKCRLTNSVFSLNQGPIVLHQLSKVCSAVIDLLLPNTANMSTIKNYNFFLVSHFTVLLLYILQWMYVYNNFTSSVFLKFAAQWLIYLPNGTEINVNNTLRLQWKVGHMKKV